MGVNAPRSAVDATFTALADPARRRAVELLSAAPRRSGELATLVGVSPATMSKHLRVLRRSGLVSQRHAEFDTRVRIYSLTSAPMTELRRWLADTEQGWVDQLGAFADHVAGLTESERDLDDGLQERSDDG